MDSKVIGVLHPGAMGAPVGACMQENGHTVLWASAGRSGESRDRAVRAGLIEVDSVAELVRRSDIVMSICPPHAAIDVARSAAGARMFVDANAVSPATAAAVAEVVASTGGSFVDGGIIGPPPVEAGTTRFYLSGAGSVEVARLFEGSALDARSLAGASSAPRASALKMCYAAWTKGTDALLMGILAAASSLGAHDDLIAEWELSQPALLDRLVGSAWATETKGWRFVGEMEEIASTFESIGLPGGFHLAAAETFGRVPHNPDAPQARETLDRVVAALAATGSDPGSAEGGGRPPLT